MFPKILSKAFIDNSKELESLNLSDWPLHGEMHWHFPLHTIVFLGHLCLFHSVDFISHLITVKFLVRLDHKLVSLVTFWRYFFSWIPCY